VSLHLFLVLLPMVLIGIALMASIPIPITRPFSPRGVSLLIWAAGINLVRAWIDGDGLIVLALFTVSVITSVWSYDMAVKGKEIDKRLAEARQALDDEIERLRRDLD